MYKIIYKKSLTPTITLMKVLAPDVTRHAKAGQFIILRVDEKGERIPLTIADIDHALKSVTIIFQVVGKTTYLLNMLSEGDDILDFVGPLGKPTEIENLKKVLVIGGGVGSAIAYPLCKALFEQNTQVELILGFKSKDQIILKEAFETVTNHQYMTTDDGSYGEKGFVTDQLNKILKKDQSYDHVFAIGPIPMMKAVSDMTKNYQIPTTVSLNPIMIDGTGMCGGCRVKVGDGIKFACVDGPDFDGHQVDYDALLKRNMAYRLKEQKDFEDVLKRGEA
ncbi:ferredoxin-NADP reductase [Tenericutes bacterium MZ-XQ]|nr:ferredoxin-NADP reductase [Tenericutes bacterium MZ-XQ]